MASVIWVKFLVKFRQLPAQELTKKVMDRQFSEILLEKSVRLVMAWKFSGQKGLVSISSWDFVFWIVGMLCQEGGLSKLAFMSLLAKKLELAQISPPNSSKMTYLLNTIFAQAN